MASALASRPDHLGRPLHGQSRSLHRHLAFPDLARAFDRAPQEGGDEAHHRSPVMELPLLRVRPFALANLAALVFFAGFGSMLLSGVPLLTGLWGYSELTAGVGLSVGSLPAAVTAKLPASRFATGTAAFGTARQLGTAIGVAILVALVDASGDLLAGLRRGRWLALGAGLLSGVLALALGPLGPEPGRRASSPIDPALPLDEVAARPEWR